MEYRYVAYTKDRKVIKGAINATSQSVAEQALRNSGQEPLSVSMRAGFDLAKLFPSLVSIKSTDIADFSRQLALLLECGVTIASALQLLSENVASKPLRKVIGSLNSELRSGSSLSGALAKHPKIFGELYCRVVAVGERTGTLETSLREVVSYMEKQQTSAKKTKKALTYPMMVLIMAFGVAALMTTVVLPQMSLLYSAMKVELPLPTRMLMGFSAFVSAYKVQLLAAIILFIAGLLGLSRSVKGKRLIQTALLRAPLLGRVNMLAEVSRFSRTMAMLLHGGLNMPEIMDLAIRGTKNILVQEALSRVKTHLMQGRSLASAMSGNSLFPNALVQMVTVGEETGRLETTLGTIAAAYEQEADDKTTIMISFIEPAMTVVIAVVVGFIALSVIMPMYTIIGSMS